MNSWPLAIALIICTAIYSYTWYEVEELDVMAVIAQVRAGCDEK